jgi:thiaminase
MRSIISDRGRYIRTMFAYTTNFGMISEISLDMKELRASKDSLYKAFCHTISGNASNCYNQHH